MAVFIEGVIVTTYAGSPSIGDPLFISTTAGDMTRTAPTGTGDIVRGVGHCIAFSGTEVTVSFRPDVSWIEI